MAKLRREPKTEAPLAPADAAVHSCLQQRIASGRVYRVAFPIICVRHDGPAVVFHVPECMARNRHSCQSANGAQAERLVGGMCRGLRLRISFGPLIALVLAFSLPVMASAQEAPDTSAARPEADSAAAAPAPTAPTAAPAPPASVSPTRSKSAAATNADATSSDIRFALPRDLSPWGMFLSADVVVKAVMIGLALASLLTWTIWLAKTVELMTARRSLRGAIAMLDRAQGWADVFGELAPHRQAGALVRAADDELRLSAGAHNPEGLKERIASRLERLEAAAGRRMIRGTGVLASVGATAPFVGLFGTVWGIMNSFIGISKQHTTNLAVVAPGIAEALLATAFGLVAAIPAVVMYNMFSRWNAGYRALHGDATAAILRVISRDLDRGAFEGRAAERRRSVAAAE